MNKTQTPYIPVETQKRMHAFFMKTSAPRMTDDVYLQICKEVEEIENGNHKRT